MEGFLERANQMIEDANLSIKNYNKLIKEYENKGFFGKMFSADPEDQERKINSKKGIIENINEKKKSYPLELKKVKIQIYDLEKKIEKSQKIVVGKNFEKENQSLVKVFRKDR